MRSLLLAEILLCVLVIPGSCSFANAGTPEESIAKLRAIPLRDDAVGIHGDEFFDMHGNASKDLQALMIERFAATVPICRELERPGLPPRYAEALYDVLAFVKDPAVIPWLERRGLQDENAALYQSLIGDRWRTQLYGAFQADSRWLRQPDQWAAFFRRVIANTTQDGRRLSLERVLAGWFHDQATIGFFVRLEKAAPVQTEELLLAQLYLRQHRLSYDTAKTKASIAALKFSEAGRKTLLEYAEQLRDPVFVPWLIEIVEPADAPVKVGNAQWILEKITFARGISGRSNWQEWFQRHQDEDRRQWIAASLADLARLTKTNPPAAHAILEKAVYRWNDLEALPGMREFVPQPALANDLIGWINLSYHPERREELQALADEIIRIHRAALAPWTINLLELLDFIPHRPLAWDDYVAQSNANL